MNSELMFSSNTDDWETPQDFFDELNKEFDFTLDPCADERNHKCEKYFTKEQDGLVQCWKNERVFCNPPYGREIGSWVKRCFLHSRIENGIAVMLIPARTDTKWFHEYIYNKENVEARFVKGRLKFGGSKNYAPFPSMVVVFKRKQESAENDTVLCSSGYGELQRAEFHYTNTNREDELLERGQWNGRTVFCFKKIL